MNRNYWNPYIYHSNQPIKPNTGISNPQSYYPPGYQYPYSYQHYSQTSFITPRNFPAINSKTFMTAGKQMDQLLSDARLLSSRIAQSKEFADSLMRLAQESKTDRINQIVRKTGIKHYPVITYDPDGIHFDFRYTPTPENNCCRMVLNFRWS